MGDFNDEPWSLAADAMRASSFESVYTLPVSHDDVFVEPHGRMAPWTTWKKRSHELKHTIDFIWFAGCSPSIRT